MFTSYAAVPSSGMQMTSRLRRGRCRARLPGQLDHLGLLRALSGASPGEKGGSGEGPDRLLSLVAVLFRFGGVPGTSGKLNSWFHPRPLFPKCRVGGCPDRGWRCSAGSELRIITRLSLRLTRRRHARFSNEDPAKSGLESKRILNVEGGFS